MAKEHIQTLRQINKPPRYKVLKGDHGRIELTEEQERVFRRLYPTHYNKELMQMFGIGIVTVSKLGKQLGLEKDMPTILKKQGRDISATYKEEGIARGRRPSPQCIAASMAAHTEGRCAPYSRIKVEHPRLYKKIMKQRGEARRALIESERRRIRLGLEPKTRLRDSIIDDRKKLTKRETCRRHYAGKRGYILYEWPTRTMYYDSETQRGERFERTALSEGWKIEPWTPEIENI